MKAGGSVCVGGVAEGQVGEAALGAVASAAETMRGGDVKEQSSYRNPCRSDKSLTTWRISDSSTEP